MDLFLHIGIAFTFVGAILSVIMWLRPIKKRRLEIKDVIDNALMKPVKIPPLMWRFSDYHKQYFKNTKHMNNLKEYKIIAPEGKVIDEKALKEGKIEFIDNDPLADLPESWEELGEITGEWLDDYAGINTLLDNKVTHSKHKNVFVQGLGKAYRAHMMLSQLIYRYNGNSFVDWEDSSEKHVAYFAHNDLVRVKFRESRHFLAFKTPELRDKFISAPKIRELIEIAKPIL